MSLLIIIIINVLMVYKREKGLVKVSFKSLSFKDRLIVHTGNRKFLKVKQIVIKYI